MKSWTWSEGSLNSHQELLDNFMLPILCQQFGDDTVLSQHDCAQSNFHKDMDK